MFCRKQNKKKDTFLVGFAYCFYRGSNKTRRQISRPVRFEEVSFILFKHMTSLDFFLCNGRIFIILFVLHISNMPKFITQCTVFLSLCVILLAAKAQVENLHFQHILSTQGRRGELAIHLLSVHNNWYDNNTPYSLQVIIIIIIIIIINLIYIGQFDTNGILTALYIVITYIQMQYETIISVHIYMSTHKHIHSHMYKYISTNIRTRLPILT